MNTLQLKPAKVKREELLADEVERKKIEHQRVYEEVNLWLNTHREPVYVTRKLMSSLSEQELCELVGKVIEVGYTVLIAKDYFCIEVPMENASRVVGLYIKDLSELKDQFVEKGFVVNDL